MAEVRKVLGQAAPAATTETDLYIVASSSTGVNQAVSSSVVICNRGGAAGTFRVSVSVAGGATVNKDYLFYDVSVAKNTTYVATLGATLGSSDVVRVYASSANFSFSLFGVELT